MKQRSIHKKLTRSYLILLVAVVLVLLAGFVMTLWLSVLPNMSLTMQSKINELQSRVSEQFSYLERAADTAFLNLNGLEPQLLLGEGDGSSLARYNAINNCLYQMRQVYSDVEHAFLLDTAGNAYADNIILEEQLSGQFPAELNETLEAARGKTHVFGIRSIPGTGSGEPLLLVGKMIRCIDNCRKVGYLYVAADQTALKKLYNEQLICRGQEIYLCGSDGTVLSSTDDNALGKRPGLGELAEDRLFIRCDGKICLYKCLYDDTMQATLILTIPAFELYRNSGLSILVILLSVFVGLCLAMYESGSITRRILTPLLSLTKAVNEISGGNMRMRCRVDKVEDEISLLAASFNSMLDRIERLLEQIRREHGEKLRSQLAVQQNKIQPHFLYNTINLISVLCEMEMHEEASHMARLTAQYYRGILNDGNDVITIGQELQNIELYFQIVLTGRKGFFEYSIDCCESAKAAPIPKMSLQPLVENAVKYAFVGRENNRIHIRAEAEGGMISITVKDNGIGLTKDEFSQKMERRQEGHFGIYSVCERMKLLCGGNFVLEARSHQGPGAEILLAYDLSAIEEGIV